VEELDVAETRYHLTHGTLEVQTYLRKKMFSLWVS
jgi:hypothetical protein